MSIHPKPIFLQTAVVALLLASAQAGAEDAQATTGWPISSAIETETGGQIPAGAQGVLHIDAPREATLLQLRGVHGSGHVILRNRDNRDCLTLPVRFIAGDFGGETISIHSGESIRLIIKSARVADALADGDDVVSDMYSIGSTEDDLDADIIIQSGLSDGRGFVINPGSSFLADIIGAEVTRVKCSELQGA